MGMEEHDELNPETRRGGTSSGRFPRRSGMNDDGDGGAVEEEEEEEQERQQPGVALRVDVSPVGQGFFVEGAVKSVIRVECECCGCAFPQHRSAPIKVWLDDSAAEEDSSGEWEILPFPRHQEELDLTPFLRDTIRMNAPFYENLCEVCAEEEEVDEDGTNPWSGGKPGFVFKLEDDE